MNMKQTSRMLALYIGFPLVLLLAAGGLYSYLYEQTGASVERSVKAAGVIASEAANQSQNTDLAAEYAATASDRSQISGFFVPADNAVVFIEGLEGIASSSGAVVSISAINADNLSNAAPGALGSVSADLSVRGSWPAVMRALVLAESLPYQGIVDDLALTQSEDPGKAAGAPIWQASFQVTATMIASATSSTPLNTAMPITSLFGMKKHEAPASGLPRKSFGHELVTDPRLDWLLILAIACILALALVAAGIYVYLDAGAQLSAQPHAAASAGAPAFDDAELKDVLGSFSLKAAVTAGRASQYPVPPDPSLP